MLTNSILLGSFSVERMIDILCHIGTGLEELNEVKKENPLNFSKLLVK